MKMKTKIREAETTTLISKSSSKRKSSPEPKNIGCMSGIFSLVSRYHQRRKFLTSGEKKEKKAIPSPAKPAEQSVAPTPVVESEMGKFACQVKRSPTIASEIRRSDTSITLLESPESVLEKRRELMESLQKCEEDLNSLKTIIEAVRSTDHQTILSPRLSSSTEVRKECLIVEVVEGGDLMKQNKKCCEMNNDQPSPVSVLDVEDLSCSPSPVYNRFSYPATGCIDLSFFHRLTLEPSLRVNHREDKECDYLSWTRTTTTTKTNLTSPFWSSKTKAEIVKEAYEEAIWEERWEIERIGVMLEDYMFRDLIEETVRDLRRNCYVYSLPYDACRRRLRF